MAVQIQFRRDTDANWTSANPTLAAGEMGINTTTNQFKIGNGSTAWNSLSYAPISGTVAQLNAIEDVTITSAANGDLLKWNGSAWVNAAGYALLNSPTLTGTPEAPTAAANTNTTQIATTAFVTGAVTDLIGGAPNALNTLNELAEAIGDDASYAAGITTALGLKAPLDSPTFTGTVTIPTGASITAPTGLVKGDVGLGSVDNTADTAKPVSTAQQTALDLKANLASPTFTGTVTVPTPVNATDAVTKTYVDSGIAGATITSLNDVGDVTITSASAGDFLKWNGTAFVNDPIDLGTDTVGNYMVEVSAGTGISVSHTASEGSTATISAKTDSDQFVLSAAVFS
jgi:hypothetical protein